MSEVIGYKLMVPGLEMVLMVSIHSLKVKMDTMEVM